MSEVTDILTGRLNLKRLTSYLLDATAVASSLSATRQPLQNVRLELEVVGCTVSASGRVTVYSNSGAGVSQYVVQDRTLGTKWAITVADGVLSISSSVASVSTEPIIEDNLVSGARWKLFVNDGVIGVEASSIVQDDVVLLNDTVTATTYRITVSDGILGIVAQSANSEVFTFSENRTKVGSVDFSTVDGITLSGITDGFLKIRAVSKLGQPVNQEISVASSVPCRFYTQKGRIHMKKAGQELVADYKIMFEPTLDVRENDLVYPLSDVVGLTMGQIGFVEKIFDFDGATHHTEAELIDL